MKKPIIITLLSLFILSGCQNPSLEANNNGDKESCRPWIENAQRSCQKKIDVWEDKFNTIQNESENNSLVFKKGTVEYERYYNKKYGYTIEVPKSWGSLEYMEFGGQYEFSDELNDDMKFIGPYLSRNSESEYIQIKILLNDDIPKKYESLLEYYESEFLDDKHYKSIESIDENGNFVKIYNEFIPNSNNENFDCLNRRYLSDLERELCQSSKYGLMMNVDGEYYVRTYKLIKNDKGAYVFSYYKENNIQEYIVNSVELE